MGNAEDGADVTANARNALGSSYDSPPVRPLGERNVDRRTITVHTRSGRDLIDAVVRATTPGWHRCAVV